MSRLTTLIGRSFLLVVFASGCSSKSGTGSLFEGDSQGVAVLIEDINDAKGNARRATGMFVKGTAPTAAELRRYAPYSYYIVGKPKVTGAEATAEVSICREADGAEAAKQTWSFVKEGDAWKIKAAPLP